MTELLRTTFQRVALPLVGRGFTFLAGGILLSAPPSMLDRIEVWATTGALLAFDLAAHFLRKRFEK